MEVDRLSRRKVISDLAFAVLMLIGAVMTGVRTMFRTMSHAWAPNTRRRWLWCARGSRSTLVGDYLKEETGPARAEVPRPKEFDLSVFVTLTVPADPAKVEQAMQADADRVRRINEEAKGMGAIHHRFLGGEDVVMVLDEWDSPESFHKFFENNTDVAAMMQEVGVTSAPDIKVWKKLDTRDEF